MYNIVSTSYFNEIGSGWVGLAPSKYNLYEDSIASTCLVRICFVTHRAAMDFRCSWNLYSPCTGIFLLNGFYAIYSFILRETLLCVTNGYLFILRSNMKNSSQDWTYVKIYLCNWNVVVIFYTTWLNKIFLGSKFSTLPVIDNSDALFENWKN